MKKLIIIIISILIVLGGLFGESDNTKSIFIGLKGNIMFPSDSGFKNVYGSNMFCPGAEFGFKLKNNIYFVAGFDIFKKDGETPVLKEISESEQTFISLGAGYIKNISDRFYLRGDAGILSISYEEKAFGEKITGSSFGFYLQGGAEMIFGERFYISSLAGYSSASDKIDDLSIKLGGLKISIILGVVF